MILYGRMLSPYTRRIAVSLALQGRAFRSVPILVVGEDFRRLKTITPVGRVPVLDREDGSPVMIESTAIMDWIEQSAPEGRNLFPESGEARVAALQITGLANAVMEKAVALVYERNRRPPQYHWPEWLARLEAQIRGGLDALESRTPEKGFFGGDAPDGRDVFCVVAYSFVGAMHPALREDARWPRMAALAEAAERLPAFTQNKLPA